MSWAGVALKDASVIAEAGVNDIEQIVRQHARFVFGVAYSVLRNREDAEDAAQESFLRLSRQRNLADIRDVRLWLARVAWRVAVDHTRKHREQPSGDAEVLQTVADYAPAADQIVIERQMRELMDRMVAALPSELRDVVRLTTVQEMSSADVAEVLGIPEGSVRQRMFRARRLLREKMLAALEKKS
jgi:RNA polymerase sigma-70 factor, ECF subfamily